MGEMLSVPCDLAVKVGFVRRGPTVGPRRRSRHPATVADRRSNS